MDGVTTRRATTAFGTRADRTVHIDGFKVKRKLNRRNPVSRKFYKRVHKIDCLLRGRRPHSGHLNNFCEETMKLESLVFIVGYCKDAALLHVFRYSFFHIRGEDIPWI